TVLLLFAALTASILLYSGTPVQSQSVHQPLAAPANNGHLAQIGRSANLQDGARIFFRTNFTACGILRAHSPNHEFVDGSSAPALLVEWNGGKQEWLKSKSMAHAWVQANSIHD